MLRKAWQAIRTLISGLIDLVLIATFVSSLAFLVVMAPDAHHSWIRHKVGSVTYLIQTSTGSGTGFAIKAPSGTNYIVTNAHVCDRAVNVDVVDVEGNKTTNRVLKEADNTDLCLIEGRPGVEGLSMGSEPRIGNILETVGHPSSLPLSTSKGELYEIGDTTLNMGVILDTPMNLPPGSMSVMAQADCMKSINYIQRVDIQQVISEVKHLTPAQYKEASALTGYAGICIEKLSKAFMTTNVVSPGSSGSPVVDRFGRVVAVVVGYQENQYGWATMVSYTDLLVFIKDL